MEDFKNGVKFVVAVAACSALISIAVSLVGINARLAGVSTAIAVKSCN